MITLPIDGPSPTGLCTARPTVVLPAMPCEIHYRGGQKLKPNFVDGATVPTFNLQAKTQTEFVSEPFETFEPIARRLTDSFLGVKTPEEALQFLASSGHFLWDAWAWQHPCHTDELTWPDFVSWQELIRDIIANGFLIAQRDETAEGGISSIDSFPASRLDTDRKRLLLSAPETTFELLNGNQPAFALEFRHSHAEPARSPAFALVTETFTTLDTILARIYIESITADC